MQLLPGEALALMNKIVLDDDLLSKMGVDKDDLSMVTGVKFMMVDTGMDEETVRLVSVGSFSIELLFVQSEASFSCTCQCFCRIALPYHCIKSHLLPDH
jgi:hypothetical protein